MTEFSLTLSAFYSRWIPSHNGNVHADTQNCIRNENLINKLHRIMSFGAGTFSSVR